jgi:translation initiation factor 2 alpha subunit (eIF-2alpha)
VIWKHKQDVHIPINVHKPPVENNFCDEHRGAHKPDIMETTVSKQSMSTKGTEQLIAIQLVEEHGSIHKLFKPDIMEITVSKQTMSTKGTEQLIAIQLVGKRGSVYKLFFCLVGSNNIEWLYISNNLC